MGAGSSAFSSLFVDFQALAQCATRTESKNIPSSKPGATKKSIHGILGPSAEPFGFWYGKTALFLNPHATASLPFPTIAHFLHAAMLWTHIWGGTTQGQIHCSTQLCKEMLLLPHPHVPNLMNCCSLSNPCAVFMRRLLSSITAVLWLQFEGDQLFKTIQSKKIYSFKHHIRKTTTNAKYPPATKALNVERWESICSFCPTQPEMAAKQAEGGSLWHERTGKWCSQMGAKYCGGLQTCSDEETCSTILHSLWSWDQLR